MVAEGQLRQDLLYRINVIDVHVPPLRDRPEDLAPLVAHFLDKHAERFGRPGSIVSAEAMAMLRRHDWPGNVRELENVIERALVLGTRDAIHVEDLPENVRAQPPAAKPQANQERQVVRPLADVEREHILRTLRALGGNKSAAARALGVDRKTLSRKLGHPGILRRRRSAAIDHRRSAPPQ
jgi:two-component system response regulator HydG